MVPSHQASAGDVAHARILVVDDKPMAREMVHAALADRAQHVRQTMSVDKAIELLGEPGAQVNCIVADWDMLPVGGLELLRMVRCRVLPNVDPRAAFVIFTSRAEEAAVKCAVDLDVNGFAVAPLSLEKLSRSIEAALKRSWVLQDVSHYASVPCVVPPPVTASPIVSTKLSTAAGASASAPLRHVQPGSRAPGHAPARMCGLNEVTPGAVLARDVRDINGSLLLRTGTALDPAIIHRLRKAAGASAARYQVWVRT